MAPSCADVCRDLNTISTWLACDGCAADEQSLESLQVIVLFGNQVIPTLVAACQLAQQRQRALLFFSGGIGHATCYLHENLAVSAYAHLIREGLLTSQMGEAQLYAVIAQRVFDIPSSRIRVEAESTNGGENARFTLRLMEQEDRAGSTVLLLQDPLMQRRAVLTWEAEARRAGFPALTHSRAAFVPRVEPGADGMPQLIAAHATGTWTFPRFLGLLLGEVARLRDDENGYGPRGRNFLPHVDIPREVEAAYQRLHASPVARLATR